MAAWGWRHREDGSAVRHGSSGDGDGGGNDNDDVLVAGARSGGDRSNTEACDGGNSSWTPSPTLHEQQLEREETPFFFQMTARVCGGGVPSPLIEPKMG